MLNLSFAGTLGRDAEYKESQNGKGRCQFSVAVNVDSGENKQTYWIDVTKFGQGANGLSRILTKGTKVAGSGKFRIREHNGKTYYQCWVDDVTLLGGAKREESKFPVNKELERQFAPQSEQIDDEIPF